MRGHWVVVIALRESRSSAANPTVFSKANGPPLTIDYPHGNTANDLPNRPCFPLNKVVECNNWQYFRQSVLFAYWDANSVHEVDIFFVVRIIPVAILTNTSVLKR